MKANELMIGDWVKYIYNPRHDSVEWIGKMIPQMFLYPSDYELKPIPLTQEFLEKNGFYFGYTTNEEDMAHLVGASYSPESKGWCWCEDGTIKVIFPKECDGGEIYINGKYELNLIFSETIFVHELQHAFRLCGIDKEITL